MINNKNFFDFKSNNNEVNNNDKQLNNQVILLNNENKKNIKNSIFIEKSSTGFVGLKNQGFIFFKII
jgi:hypothetical protein